MRMSVIVWPARADRFFDYGYPLGVYSFLGEPETDGDFAMTDYAIESPSQLNQLAVSATSTSDHG
jgi:hypothetical protein